MKKLQAKNNKLKTSRGFTLIETLVAITILTTAVAAPLTLAAQSLIAAYNARDQVIAFHLAQEAVETVRAQRDHNLLESLKTVGSTVGWLNGMYVQLIGELLPEPFMVDSISSTNNFILCSGSDSNTCNNLLFNDAMGFYGHEIGVPSKFKRFVNITEVPNTNGEEVTVRSEVQWRFGSQGNTRSVIIEQNLFNWTAGISN